MMAALKMDNEKIETELLLAGIQKRYGYDFTHYSHASLMRRLEKARELARELRDDALRALDGLPEQGGHLRQLADFIVLRKF